MALITVVKQSVPGVQAPGGASEAVRGRSLPVTVQEGAEWAADRDVLVIRPAAQLGPVHEIRPIWRIARLDREALLQGAGTHNQPRASAVSKACPDSLRTRQVARWPGSRQIAVVEAAK